MAIAFGAAVDGEVFWGGDGAEVFGVSALETADELVAEGCGEGGIFAVGFLAASPAWVAEDINIRRPDGEPEVDGVEVIAEGLVIFCAGLGGDDGADLVEEGRIPGGGHADGLRE